MKIGNVFYVSAVCALILCGQASASLRDVNNPEARGVAKDTKKIVLMTSVRQENIDRQVPARPDSGYVGGGAIGAAISYSINAVAEGIRKRRRQRGVEHFRDMLKTESVPEDIQNNIREELLKNGFDIVGFHPSYKREKYDFRVSDYLTGEGGGETKLLHIYFDYSFGPELNVINVNAYATLHTEKKTKKKLAKRRFSSKKWHAHYQVPSRAVKYIPLSESDLKKTINDTYKIYDEKLAETKRGSKKIKLRKLRDKKIKYYKRRYSVESDGSTVREEWSKDNLYAEIDKGFGEIITALVNAMGVSYAEGDFVEGEIKMPYTIPTYKGIYQAPAIPVKQIIGAEDDTHNIYFTKKNTTFIVPKGEVFQYDSMLR